MKELFGKIPDMIDVILQKALESPTRERPETRAAKDKLITRLRRINKEMKSYSKEEGEGLTEDQKALFTKYNALGIDDKSIEALKLDVQTKGLEAIRALKATGEQESDQDAYGQLSFPF